MHGLETLRRLNDEAAERELEKRRLLRRRLANGLEREERTHRESNPERSDERTCAPTAASA